MVKAYEHNAGIIRHLDKHNNDDSKKQLVSIDCDIIDSSIIVFQ